MNVDFEKLRFIRVFTPDHIPRSLVDQVRGKSYSTDRFFQYQSNVCVESTEQGTRLNPLNLLYVIANSDNKVVGYLWCEVSALENALVVQTFSMEKEYWCQGKAMELAAGKVKEILRESKLDKAYWITNYPKHSERYGFRRSKGILMEYEETDDGKSTNGQQQTDGFCEHVDTRTATVPGDNAVIDTGASSAVLPTVSTAE